jgi:CTP synthase
MTILLVEHATPVPAVDGLAAAEVAARVGGIVVHTVAGGAGLGRFDCAQHVLRSGALAPNGLLWAERATGRPVGEAVDRGAVASLPDDVVVVPVNPAVPAQVEAAERIRAKAARIGRAVEDIRVEDVDGGWRVGAGKDGAPLRLDAFGRPVADGATPVAAGAAPVVLVVADERLQRDVYPANLAALGDAAEALGIAVEVRFADPRRTSATDLAGLIGRADGVVLPGGSDMEQVAGQIEAARAALRADVPTLGLCLGMQSMCTAVAQDLAGLTGANLAEADPSAPIKTFVRLNDPSGRPEFRLGGRTTRVSPGSLFAGIVDAPEIEVRYNHRFVLDPALHDRLMAAGLRVGGWHIDRDLVDAVELPGHRFFVGMQGHPELTSRREAPAPVVKAFLAAAAGGAA